MSDEKTTSEVKNETKVSEVKVPTSKDKVFNFTRQGVTIIAKTRQEAEKALKDKSKVNKEIK